MIWLEQCIYGDNKGEVRAIERTRKSKPSFDFKELETVALFSQAKVLPTVIVCRLLSYTLH